MVSEYGKKLTIFNALVVMVYDTSVIIFVFLRYPIPVLLKTKCSNSSSDDFCFWEELLTADTSYLINSLV